ncbi:MAG TPA: hypothetical protein VJ810_24755 [Blastocatellia bacterium]|nr:hypothetical protein [Blastocatellia bacterium]
MARLIEVQDVSVYPSSLMVHPGDLLLFWAVGGQVQSGDDVVEMLGPFVQAVLGNDGNILTPAGTPNTILFYARQAGSALIDVITGDLFHSPKTNSLSIDVEN